jgi:dipeptidyl aminopeptidase/acylaminoacyl peptidase
MGMTRLFAALLAGAALTGMAHAQGTAPAMASAAPQQAEAIPLEAFSHWPEIAGPRISPGGKAIAAKVRFQGKQALAIVPIGAGAKPEIVAEDGKFDQEDDLVIQSWRWVDDDNLLISLSSRQNMFGQWFDATRLVAYNRSTKKTTPLAWRGSLFSASRVLWVSREGPPTILLERTPDNKDTEMMGSPEVIRVNVQTGETEIVQHAVPGVGGWSADGDGVVRLGTGYDRESGKLTALYRADARANLKTIYSGRPDLYSGIPLPDIFLKAGDKAITLTRKDGYSAVYELDLNTMQVGRKLFGVTGYDVDNIFSGVDDDTLAAVATIEKRSHRYYFDPREKEIQQLLEETFGVGNVVIESSDRAREMVVARVSHPGAPGGYYVYDTRSGGVALLGWVNSVIKDRSLNPVTTIHYKASDGKDIEAVLTMPRHRVGQKNLPLIVLPHGGPADRDSEDWEYVPWAQPLAEMGYVVVQPNYRGSSGYGRDWEKASEGNWGERMQDDLNDAVTYLASQGIVDPKRVCMMGWSYGGYAASRAAQRDGGKYRCAISGAGVHDLPAMVAYDKNYLGEYGAKTGLGAAGKLQAVSPGLHAAQYSTPILIIHGEHDQRVPVSQSRDLVRRLKEAGKVEGRDFVYVELPRETHNLLLESSRERVLEEIKKFMDAHNPA